MSHVADIGANQTHDADTVLFCTEPEFVLVQATWMAWTLAVWHKFVTTFTDKTY